MSDRTQTVALTFEEIYALLEPDTRAETPAFISGFEKLRAALFQPEHQGELNASYGEIDAEMAFPAPEHQGDEIPDDFWREIPCGHPPDPVAMYNRDGRAVCHCGAILDSTEPFPGDVTPPEAPGPIVLCPMCGCYVAIPPKSPPTQPPAPVLSDEERERLLDDDGSILLSLREEVGAQIVGEGLLDSEGDELGFNDPVTERIGDQLSAHVKDSLDTALRTLASREQGGEEERRKPASADEVRGILKGYSAPEPPEPDVDLHPMHGMGAHEAWMDGWAKGHAAASSPPPGEIEGLRELLAWAEREAVEMKECTTREGYSPEEEAEGQKLGRAFDRMAAKVRAALPPSDSQGDQERCQSCGRPGAHFKAGRDLEWLCGFGTGCHPNAVKDDPDCNTAPTKIECGECPRGEMVLSSERVYECNVCPARMSLETYERSRQPDPAPTQIEGDIDRELTAPEGGDEEDWPGFVAEAKQALADFDSHGDYEAPVALLRGLLDRLPVLAPAPSQDSLAEELAKRLRESEAAAAPSLRKQAIEEEWERALGQLKGGLPGGDLDRAKATIHAVARERDAAHARGVEEERERVREALFKHPEIQGREEVCEWIQEALDNQEAPDA